MNTRPTSEQPTPPALASVSGYMPWLLKLKCLAHENGVKHLIPKDEAKMLPSFECGWTPEMALDDLMLQSQYGI